MSDFGRLQDKLAKLSKRDVGRTGPRELAGRSAEALLAAMVVEVDETILPRILTFTTDTDVTLHMAVANRRLQALVAPAPSAVGDAAGLAGQALGAGDDDTLARLRGGLLDALDGATTMGIATRRPADGEGFPAESGVPVAVLARSWDLSLDAEPPSGVDPVEGMTRFLAAAKEQAAAWLRIDGEDVSDQGGEPERLERMAGLAEFLDTFLSRREAMLLPADAPSCFAIGPMEGTDTLLVADHGPTMAVLLVEAGTAEPVLDAWQDAMGLT